MNIMLKRMFRYTAWANDRTLSAVRDQSAVQELAIPILSHMIAAEHIWLKRLLGQPVQVAVWPNWSVEECEKMAVANAEGLLVYTSRVTDKQLMRKITFRSMAGQEYSTMVIDILTHVVTHGAYHRGQIARILGQSLGVAVNTDFIVFANEVPMMECNDELID